MNTPYIIDVFLSRKSQDAHLSKILYDFLTAKGLKVFDSNYSLLEMGNADYSRAIDDALAKTDNLIVIGSSAKNISSLWVEAEWRFFLNRKRSGKAKGNLLSVVSSSVTIDSLPASLQNYEVILFDLKNFDKILAYVGRNYDSKKQDSVEPSPVQISTTGQPAETGSVGVEESYRRGVSYFENKDFQNAVDYLTTAAKQGNIDAQKKLGCCYWGGGSSIKNHEMAGKWYGKAAEQGDAEAQYRLGIFYKDSIIHNYSEAVKWYQKAAEQGHIKAQYSLGSCYKEGKGVDRNYTEAIKWYRKAAEHGDGLAQYVLGNFYQEGKIITRNYGEAMKWYLKASVNSDDWCNSSLYAIGRMYAKGEGVPKDRVQAVKWYHKAAEQGNAYAQQKLSIYYERGWGVSKNHKESRYWRRKAIENGYIDSHTEMNNGNFLKSIFKPVLNFFLGDSDE